MPEVLADEARGHEAARILSAALAAQRGDSHFAAVYALSGDEPALVVRRQRHGVATTYTLGRSFIASADYGRLSTAARRFAGLFEPDAYLELAPERCVPAPNFAQVYAALLNDARRGLAVQRYKGLGEMNPDQLWETTMDYAQRRLLAVRIEDVVAADRMFSTLMGDQVDPRRDFIETNALAVANLDV